MPDMPDAPAPAPETTTTLRVAAEGVEDARQAIASLAATADPVAAERARCAAIQSAMQPGFALLAALAVTAGWPVEQFTAAQAASAEAVENARIEGAGASFRQSLPAPVDGGGAAPPAPQAGEDAWKAEYAASDALRREFASESAYLSFKRAEAAGKVRILSKRA